jgi:hypothetical protein
MKILKTRKGLALRFEVDPRTIRKYLSEIGVTHRSSLKNFEVDRLIQYLESGKKPETRI